uniref:Uncharacterized protein AlNc14C21G2150 n=1 Tax=Albugo laibachii Nc14 TaxID=890382 RepID=F0W5I5_9STRA|nr:conserved hypothetical protein [Albugo laibachii Nc14]|eukprot:CCA16376.1 conserved hypothetical protein [Albugo laibachii Nc14]
MERFIQVTGRANKSAVGFQIQLIVHRMTASLPACQGIELTAMLIRKKKKIVSKSSLYQSTTREVVWGDIFPFSTTLYLAKTGLFQAKMFDLVIFDAQTNRQIASFQFNLSEVVQNGKSSTKESLMIPVTKCQDQGASLSLTVFSSRVSLRRAQDNKEDPERFSGVHFDHSEQSISKSDSPSKINSGGHQIASKQDVTRGSRLVDSEDVDEQLEKIKLLKERLNEKEMRNTRLQQLNVQKDQTIEKLQSELRKMQSEVYIKPSKEATEDRMIDDFYEQVQVHDTFVESAIGERDNDRSSVTDLFIDARDPNGYEELHDLRESTQQIIQEHVAVITSLEKDKVLLRSRVRDLELEVERLMKHRESIEELSRSEQMRLSDDCDRFRKSLSLTDKEKEALLQQLRDLDHELNLSKEENDILLQRVQQLQHEKAEACSQVDQSQRQIEALQEKLETFSGEFATGKSDLMQSTDRYNQLKVECGALKLEAETLKVRVGDLEQALSDNEKKKKQIKDVFSDRISMSQQETESLALESRSLRSENQSLMAERTRVPINHEAFIAKVEVTSQSTETESIVNDNIDLKARLCALEEENDYYQRELIDNKMKVAELTAINEDLCVQNKKHERMLAQSLQRTEIQDKNKK